MSHRFDSSTSEWTEPPPPLKKKWTKRKWLKKKRKLNAGFQVSLRSHPSPQRLRSVHSTLKSGGANKRRTSNQLRNSSISADGGTVSEIKRERRIRRGQTRCYKSGAGRILLTRHGRENGHAKPVYKKKIKKKKKTIETTV